MPHNHKANENCQRCGQPNKPLGTWYHPDITEQKITVWNDICNPCVAELNHPDYTALDIITMESARMRYEKESDYSE